jgi:hypothetical protein
MEGDSASKVLPLAHGINGNTSVLLEKWSSIILYSLCFFQWIIDEGHNSGGRGGGGAFGGEQLYFFTRNTLNERKLS